MTDKTRTLAEPASDIYCDCCGTQGDGVAISTFDGEGLSWLCHACVHMIAGHAPPDPLLARCAAVIKSMHYPRHSWPFEEISDVLDALAAGIES